MSKSTTKFLRGLVLKHLENTLDSELDRQGPANFDLLKETTIEAFYALCLLERADILDLQWAEILALKNLVLFHEGNEVPKELVHPATLQTLFAKMHKV